MSAFQMASLVKNEDGSVDVVEEEFNYGPDDPPSFRDGEHVILIPDQYFSGDVRNVDHTAIDKITKEQPAGVKLGFVLTTDPAKGTALCYWWAKKKGPKPAGSRKPVWLAYILNPGEPEEVPMANLRMHWHPYAYLTKRVLVFPPYRPARTHATSEVLIRDRTDDVVGRADSWQMAEIAAQSFNDYAQYMQSAPWTFEYEL